MALISVQIQTQLKDALDRGIILRREGRFSEALAYMESMEGLFENQGKYSRRFYNGLGITHFNRGEMREAIRCYELALSVQAGDEDEEMETAAIEGNIANALVALERAEEAHAFLDRAEMFFRAKGEESWLADRLETRARAYLMEEKHREAVAAAKEAFDIRWNGIETEPVIEAFKTLTVCFEAYERVLAYKGEKRDEH